MSKKVGEDHYDLGKFGIRGLHELSNGFVFPDSTIPVRDYSGLYGKEEKLSPIEQEMKDFYKEEEINEYLGRHDGMDVDFDREKELDLDLE